MKIKKILCRMLTMCPEAWYIFMLAVKLTAFILVCAFVLLLEYGGNKGENYKLYMTAMSLYETGQALLLIGVLFSVCIEDVQIGRS